MNSVRGSLKSSIANRYGPDIANKIRQLEFLRKKRVRLETSLAFLKKCRDANLIPTCVRIKPKSDIAFSNEILRNASVRLLKQVIRNNHCDLEGVQRQLYELHIQCSAVLSYSDFELCDRVTYLQSCRTFELCSKGHDAKFEKLLSRKSVSDSNDCNKHSDTVINLSTITIDDTTEKILAKGLNFALSPRQIPYENIISSVEATILRNKVPPIDADALRQDVAVILRKAKLPKSNVTKEERLALNSIRENNDILIFKADKGNATVVIDSNDYDTKIRDLLNNSSIYKPVTYNPTARVTRRIRAVIRDNKELFTEDVFDGLYKPKTVQCPKLYGLPKIHKENVPLRPIVSQVNSPTYYLAKHIASVLKPLVGKTDSFVRDSRHFVEVIRDIKLEPDDIMVSFDVESLFTNIPVKECLEIVRKKLRENNISENYMTILRNCLEDNYFIYGGQYYLQIDGVAMGSPVAPVLANIWMEQFERVLDIPSSPVKLWKRYVDDVFCIMKGDHQAVEQFRLHLESIHPKIRFSSEVEVDKTLAFLDVKVTVKANGSLSHSVYRKPTHTDRYLHATSHHHPRHLDSVIRALTDRAYDLCDPENLPNELKHVQEVLKKNGYNVANKRPRRKHRKPANFEVSRLPVFMPYIKGITDKIGITLKQYSIKTVYTPLSKVAQRIRTAKDVIPFQTPGVYKVDCSCGSSYIGQTKRSIAERIKEHIAAVKNNQPYKSAIAEHILESGPNHWMELHNPTILSKDSHYHQRIVREAIEIKKYKNFNREDGFKLCSSWNPVLKKCTRRDQPSRVSCDTVSVVCRDSERFVPKNEDMGVATNEDMEVATKIPRPSRRRHPPH